MDKEKQMLAEQEKNANNLENGVVNPTFTDESGKGLEEEDPWKVSEVTVAETPFNELDGFGKVKRVLAMTIRVIVVIAALYFFICSLDFLSSAFKLLGGKSAGEVFRNNEILSNPIAGLMIGVLVTVLVQSSSTSTSIVISMVGADILTIRTAIFIVMGANIGTSVTNTIVALGQITNKNDFRRAFAGATVHDMFNWMAVIILLPLEAITGYLFHLSELIIKSLPLEQNKAAKKDLLKVITKPFTTMIIQVDTDGIKKIASSSQESHKVQLMKTCCDKVTPEDCCDDVWENFNHSRFVDDNAQNMFCTEMEKSCVKPPIDDINMSKCLSVWGNTTTTQNSTDSTMMENITKSDFQCSEYMGLHKVSCYSECEYLFKGLVGKISEEAIGAILLVVSLAILCICLFLIVKMLHQLLRGQLAVLIKKFINAEFPGRMSYFTGYIAILLGAGLTILVQSSSIFTSTLTPLVGMGVIEIDRMYPLTLGANIGTTTTGILSALAQDSNKIADSLQVAFCHLFFNISGILIFYPLPFFRPPIPLAKFLGNQTAKYRWFALVYIFCMFFIFPALVFALSIPGWYVLAGVLIPIALLCITIAVINLLQSKRPNWLPKKLRDWHFLPEPMRSLKPIDRMISKVKNCCKRDKDGLKYKSNGQAGNDHITTRM